MQVYARIKNLLLSCALTLGFLLPFHSAAYAQSCDVLYASPHERIGYNVTRELNKTIADYDAARLGAGWYLDYSTQVDPVRPNGMDYAQMIRARFPAPSNESLETAYGDVLDANPGMLWILGNEPDRPGDQQDGLTPTDYVQFYHAAYTFLKERDPSAQIAIAGIVQPTPIRLLYLSTVLSEYERLYGVEMPIDVWTAHAFILREQRPTPEEQSWGAGIPPGIEGQDALGRLYEVDEHGDLDIFKEQIIAMRQWMADNGQRDKELLITEYGILFPDWFAGFFPAETRDFMFDTFDFMIDATDDQIGLAADENRLVQRFSWFSLNSPGYDGENANFFDHSLFDNRTFEIEFMGIEFEKYVISRTVSVPSIVDLAIESVTIGAADATENQTSSTISVTVNLQNQGNIDAQNVTVRLWDQAADGTSTFLGTSTAIPALEQSCDSGAIVTIPWTVDTSVERNYNLMVDVMADNLSDDSNAANNQIRKRHFIGQLDNKSYLPLLFR